MSSRAFLSLLKNPPFLKLQHSFTLRPQRSLRMASSSGQRTLLLFLDWDGTLTATSTLPLIASIATLPDIHPSLPALFKAYSDNLKTHDQAYQPAKHERRTIPAELRYLESLHSVEKASIERVEASRIFENLRMGDVEVAASECVENGQITLRKGWAGLVEYVRSSQCLGKVEIVSVAWSRRFIYHVLGKCARMAAGVGVNVKDVEIKANEIYDDGSGRLDRYFKAEGTGIWTASDKLRVMDDLVQDFTTILGNASSVGVGLKPSTIYIGDSPTDLACLLKADIGICIRDTTLTSEQKELKETLERVRVPCSHVEKFVEHGGGGRGEEGAERLWWAGDFDEVCESGILGS